jgi:hypothetical protein
MSLDGLGYEDRNVGLAALVEGADEDGGEDNPEVIAIALPTTSNLQYASVGVGEVSTSFEASVSRAVGVGGETARGIPSRSIIEVVMVNVLRLTLTALQLKPVALSADV